VLSGWRVTGLSDAAAVSLITLGVIAAVYAAADAAAGPLPCVMSGITLALGVLLVLLGRFK
jgi:hypothetical protein